MNVATRSATVVASAVLLLASGVQAEAPKGGFKLWTGINRDASGFFSVDLDPTLPGVENISLYPRCTVSARDVNGFVTVTDSVRFVARSADNTTVAFSQAGMLSAKTDPFPDPTDARFSCGQPGETSYHLSYEFLISSRDFGCPENTFAFEACDEWPMTFLYGFGAAKSGNTRVVIVGNAVHGAYERAPDWEGVRIGRYSVGSYAPDGTRIWTKTLPAVDPQGYAIFPDAALVGDFLGDDGNDEIRIVYISGANNGAFLTKYRYLDVLSGDTIQTVVVNPNNS